ncbi:hypothetical protein ACIKP7_21205, partial [Pseudomonas caricapapayae]
MKPRKTVYIVGAGLSAGIGFPTINNLLSRIWPILPDNHKADLTEVIRFHNPDFTPRALASFPNIEELLSLMQANEQLFYSSRTAIGNFTPEKLTDIRKTWRRQKLSATPDLSGTVLPL